MYSTILQALLEWCGKGRASLRMRGHHAASCGTCFFVLSSGCGGVLTVAMSDVIAWTRYRMYAGLCMYGMQVCYGAARIALYGCAACIFGHCICCAMYASACV